MIRLPPAWGVASLLPLASGGGGRVWRATRRDGSTAIVKRLSPAAFAEARNAVGYLRWRDGHGAVRLLDTTGSLQLLEDAGDRTLSDVLAKQGDQAATEVAAQVLKRLRSPSRRTPDHLPDMRQRFSSLFARIDGPDDLYAQAVRRLEALLQNAPEPRPLHADVHHDNILEGPRGWLAIDPHGALGDPAYDAANLLYNPIERTDLRTDPVRARRLADRLGPAIGRPASIVLAYGFCHACLSSSWHLEDQDEEESERSLDVARAIRPLLED